MRAILFAVPLVGAIGLTAFGIHAGPTDSGRAAPPAKPQSLLPLSHVVLFSSGVGYFQREGEIDGTGRVDLAFQAGDINDLIKSVVLQDTGGGKVTAINYDSPDPIERTLKTFALDLTNNPTLGELLNQARGEKVEVTLQQSAGGAGGTLTASILGMAAQRQMQTNDQMTEVDVLNLMSAEGLRSVKLADVLRVRFLNPALDSELHRALELIAGGRDHQKKSVSLAFKGDGKRAVKVGYVLESPMWKTTCRLVLGPDGKASLQGWALVENTTDDDWNNVNMALVSGRPISFQMDLYQPLYVPRPTVEPERFASLRPPTYAGPMTNSQLGALGVIGPLGALGAAGGGGVAGGFGGGIGGMPFNRYQPSSQFGNLGGGFANTQVQMDDANQAARPRLTYEQAKAREKQLREARGQAKRVGAEVAGLDPTAGVESVATAEDIGDVCRYTIDERVTLPRQKSAMLPIVTQSVSATKVSIFNEAVHAKFPLLGLIFRNTAKEPLTQGPVTVYDGSAYAGDSRIQDLQPDEERLLSYALDTGTEVKVDVPDHAPELKSLMAKLGVLHATYRLRHSKVYTIKNRSPQDRALVIEQPFNTAWTLVKPSKPAEKTRDLYRFTVPVKAGQALRFEVVEETRTADLVHLKNASEATVDMFLGSRVTGPKLKEALEKMKSLNARFVESDRELAKVQTQLKDITDEQARLRANFEKVPPTSAAYKRYLEKFDSQETEIEKLRADIKSRVVDEAARRKELEDYVSGLSVEG